MAGDKRAARLGVLAAVAVILFGALGTRLWFLQTVEATELQQQVDERNITTVQLRPERGQIFDADGRLLAGNEQTLNVVVDWAAIRRDSDRAELFRRLSGWVDEPVELMEERYDANIYDPLRPMPIAEDVSEEVAAGLRERIEDFPGVSIEIGYRRIYPYAPLASHVIGYMGSVTAEDAGKYEALGYDTSAVGEDVGRAGVEAHYEPTLHGQWGEIVYEVDSHNRIVREISRREPVDGNDIQLSIDLDVQMYAERILQQQLRNRRDFVAENRIVDKPDGTRQRMDLNSGPWVHYKAPAGSVIVMNHQTGQVIAMASYPTFDNRWFSQNISGDKFDELFNTLIDTPTCGDEGQPECREDPDQAALTNRAIQGQYNMGSTFKPFVAWSALNTGMRGAGVWINDGGTYRSTSIEPDVCATGVKCEWRNSFCSASNGPCVYGSIDMYYSLAVSSDVYYYQLGEQMYLAPGTDHTLLQDQVATFGFGRDPQIDLPFAFDGRLPYQETKEDLIASGALAESEEPRVLVGDVINLAIGQGLLAASPMQLAMGYGAFANGGYLMVPRVVSGVFPPNTPAGTEAGFVDASGLSPLEQFTPTGSAIPMPEGTSQIIGGLRQNILGGFWNGRSTTAGELFATGYPPEAIPVAGKTGTAQGRYSYPWNDSSVFAAFSLDSTQPYTVVAYLEKSGFGSQGAAPIVKCVFLGLSGVIPFDAPSVAEPLDPAADQLAAGLPRVDETCMKSTTANTVHPGRSIVNGRPVD